MADIPAIAASRAPCYPAGMDLAPFFRHVAACDGIPSPAGFELWPIGRVLAAMRDGAARLRAALGQGG